MKQTLIGLALLAACCVSPDIAAAASRSISLAASHTAKLSPSEADIILSVQYQAESVEAVETAARLGLEAIKTVLKSNGHAIRGVVSSNLRANAQPRAERVYNPDGTYENVAKTTYMMSAQHAVTIIPSGEITALSRLLLTDGVTQISRVVYRAYFTQDATQAAQQAALDAANADARAIARSYNMTLGKPGRINVSSNARRPLLSNDNPDNLTFTTTANVTFELIE